MTDARQRIEPPRAPRSVLWPWAPIVAVIAVVSLAYAVFTLVTQPEDVALPTSGPVAMSSLEPSEAGNMALLEGRLAVDEGCLQVVGRDGSAAVPVLPAALTSWDGDLLTWDGKDYALGDTISLSGGGTTSNALSDPQEYYVPDACAGRAVFQVNYFVGDSQA